MNEQKVNLKHILKNVGIYSFYLAVMIEVTLVILDKSEFLYPYEGWTFRITFLLCLVKVLFTKYNRKEYLTIALFLGMGFLSYQITGRNEILRIVMFVAACKDIDMIRCLKMVFWMTLVGCLGIVLLSVTGIYGAKALTKDFGRGGIETRYILGMGHPNALHCMVWALTLLGLYLYHERMKWLHYIVLILFHAGCFLLTASKTSFLISIYMIVGFMMCDYWNGSKGKRFYGFAQTGVFVMSVLGSVMVAKEAMEVWYYNWYSWQQNYTLKTRFWALVDKALTGRISCLIETDQKEGIMSTWRLFSTPNTDYYFDMGWIRLFYWYGIIPAGIAVVVLLLLLWYFMREKKYAEITVIASAALYTVVEAHLVSVYIGRNYILFLVGMYWYKLLDRKKGNSVV
jgi:polysaccharide biosynthesis protein